MLCARCEGLLPAYVDEQLPPAQMRWIDEHVRSCQSCRKELSRQRDTRDLLERLDDACWTPPDLRLRVALALRQQGAARPSTRRSRLLVPAVAAVLALSLTVGGVAMGPLSSSLQSPALAPASHVQSPSHGRTPAMAIQL
jgi:anti-sigma factor RsiW